MRAEPCPLPELVQASRMETLPSGVQERVAAHVRNCPECQALIDALDDPDIAEPTPEERLRIRARVRSEIIEPPVTALRHGVWKWSVAAAAVLAGASATALVWYVVNRQQPQRPAAIARLEKPSLPERAGRGLVWRGVDAGAAQELSRALEPYSANNFPEAARRLSAFVERHPQNAAGHFYLGVSRMFLDANREAVAALERAERLTADDPDMSGEIAWYLALAYMRTDQVARAHERLDALCSGQHRRAAQACAARR